MTRPGPDPARVLVVVPARDEESLVGGCVAALQRAAGRVGVPVDVVVVADRCRDGTARAARAAGALVVVHEPRPGRAGGGVGAARAAGVSAGLRRVPVDGTWIASTDADTRVAPCWLEHQLDLARTGADLVLGLVDLPRTGLVDANAGWRRRYATGVDGTTHHHVHGANLGLRARTYLAAGGFAPLPAHEDVHLVHAVAALADVRVVTTVDCPVLTSDRRAGRTPDGVAHDLRTA